MLYMVIEAELQQATVEDASDGRDTDLAALVWVHRLQLHADRKLVVLRTLKRSQKQVALGTGCTPLRRDFLLLGGMVVSGVRRMNEVNARRARSAPGWVTVFGRVYHHGM